MTKIRLCFSKSGSLRFIGHLDFLKVFQQTIRRAKLPIAYSQGFNPHMQLSFALPLPLGMTSNNDYADIVLEQELSTEEIISRLNSNIPEGLYIKTAIPFEGSGAASLVSVADYQLITEINPETIQPLLSQEAIVIPKKTKSGIKDTDIRLDIFNIYENESGVMLRLAAGSGRFLNPLIVAKLLTGQETSTSSIIRHDLYRQDKEKGLISLNETLIS